MVPNTFAWLPRFLISTFSRLQKHSQIFEAPRIFNTSCIYMHAQTYVSGTKENYRKIQAIANVNTGTTLNNALE